MSQLQVAVTGFGINSALGDGIESNLDGIRNGRSGIISIRDKWEPYQLRSLVAGDIKFEQFEDMFDRKQKRFLCEPALLAAISMQHAIDHAGLSR